MVVKRGHGVNIREQDTPPYNSMDDIRQWSHGMTWAEIRRQCIDFSIPMDDDDDNDDDDYFLVEGYENDEVPFGTPLTRRQEHLNFGAWALLCNHLCPQEFAFPSGVGFLRLLIAV